MQAQNDSLKALKEDKCNEMAFRNLATSTLASIMVFNRSRPGETLKLAMARIESNNKDQNPEVLEYLTDFEKKLCSTMRRIEIRGKRGRKEPLIQSSLNEKAFESLTAHRDHVGVSERNKYVFPVLNNSSNYIRSTEALRKHVGLCDLKRHDVVTSTKLRKHIATFSQLLNLEENELDVLATFLGHNIAVHRNYYRLTEHTVQLAKCGKLLTLLSEGKCKE